VITVADYERAELDFSLREMKRGWFIHAAVYAVVNIGLIVLNLVLVAKTDDDFLWFFFPLVCWGIGLTLHYVGVSRWGARDVRRRQEQIEREAAAAH
jgi:4-amino-4-deoxy-L-arabinose transferase-like glycosyltransferase